MASLIVDRLEHLVAVAAFVGDDVFRRDPVQLRRGLSDVVLLTGREQKLHRVAQVIAGRVDLRPEASHQFDADQRPSGNRQRNREGDNDWLTFR